jgi:hypothetical protein
MAHALDNLHRGRPIFVLSTGPSLRGFDFRRLDGHLTIGVNRIVEYYHPSIMFFVDVTARVTHARALRRYTGMVIAGPGAAPHDTAATVFEINPGNRPRLPTPTLLDDALRIWALEPQIVGRTFNERLYGLGAGCQALHAAILLGGSPIFLLGYDFYEDCGGHFDDVDGTRNSQDLYAYVRQCIDQLAREAWLPAIYNCNPVSNLKCFPFMSFEAALHASCSKPLDSKSRNDVCSARLRRLQKA